MLPLSVLYAEMVKTLETLPGSEYYAEIDMALEALSVSGIH
jgi:hypothetical protein